MSISGSIIECICVEGAEEEREEGGGRGRRREEEDLSFRGY